MLTLLAAASHHSTGTAMVDDISALELDHEVDEDMRALFGDSQDSGGLFTSNSTASLHRQRQGLMPAIQQRPAMNPQLQRPQQSLTCVTNKRPASRLAADWPHKLRQPLQPRQSAVENYEDLELDMPTTSAVSCSSNDLAGAKLVRTVMEKTGLGQRCHTLGTVGGQQDLAQTTGSQVTERYASATSSQANPLRLALQQHSNSQCTSFGATNTGLLEHEASGADVSLALVLICHNSNCCICHVQSRKLLMVWTSIITCSTSSAGGPASAWSCRRPTEGTSSRFADASPARPRPAQSFCCPHIHSTAAPAPDASRLSCPCMAGSHGGSRSGLIYRFAVLAVLFTASFGLWQKTLSFHIAAETSHLLQHHVQKVKLAQASCTLPKVWLINASG